MSEREHDVWRPGLLVQDESVRAAVEVATQAEAGGVPSIWTTEFYNKNAFVRLAALASATSTIAIGSSIAVAFARAPLMTATAAADLDELSNGRLLLGLGTSTKRMNEEWYGLPFEHPAPRLAEIVRFLRAIWAHQSGPFEFEGRFYHIRLGHYVRSTPVRANLPVYTAGVNPRMLQVAGEVADGVVAHTIATARYIDEIVRPALADGAERTSRDGDPLRISSQVIAAVNDDVDEARRQAARQVAYYSTVRSYDLIFEVHGFQEERDRIRAAFRNGDVAGMQASVSEAMLREMAVFGPPEAVAEQLQRYRGIVDEPVLYSPHFEVPLEAVHANELRAIEAIRLASQ